MSKISDLAVVVEEGGSVAINIFEDETAIATVIYFDDPTEHEIDLGKLTADMMLEIVLHNLDYEDEND